MARSSESKRRKRGRALADQADAALAEASQELADLVDDASPDDDATAVLQGDDDATKALSTPATAAAAPHDDDDLAAFMAQDIQEGRRERRIEPTRILMTLAVILVLGVFLRSSVDELRYHFHDAEVVHLGSAVDLPADVKLPVNAYVTLQGVLSNKARTINGMRPGSLRRGPVQVRQMLGTHIYVEFDQNKYGKEFSQFTDVTVSGRLADFGPQSELDVVRVSFINHFGGRIPNDARLLIVDEKPGTMWRYPITFALAALMMLSSVWATLRSLRIRVVDDEDEST